MNIWGGEWGLCYEMPGGENIVNTPPLLILSFSKCIYTVLRSFEYIY